MAKTKTKKPDSPPNGVTLDELMDRAHAKAQAEDAAIRRLFNVIRERLV